VSVQLARAKLLIQTGRAGQAAADLHPIVEKAAEDHRAWAVLAEAYEADEEIDSALGAASKSVRFAPRDPSYRLLLGRLCRKSGQLDRALDELTQAQKNSPTDTRLPLELGRVYEDRREPDKALEAFQRAVALNPDCEPAHFHAGLILKQLKAYQQAAQMFERCVELNPKDSNALHQLATVQALELVHGGMHQSAVAS
jgi:tetratricopeptide (TPR) repeat protein